jgi:hypothetical protein
MKGKNVSKDAKKAPSLNAKKAPSAYQTGKITVSKIEIAPVSKKKKS